MPEERGIAVIGYSLRFPGADNETEFWNNLKAGVDSVTSTPPERSYMPGDTDLIAGYLKCPLDEFDGDFFHLSARDLPWMDPQQRLFLQVAWESLEHARIRPESLRGTRAGVFVGVTSNEYRSQMTGQLELKDILKEVLGNYWSGATGRLSHFLGLTGPSVPIENTCASSAVALHLAIQSLRSGETSLALVGGLNLLLERIQKFPPGMTAPRCKAFDASANGFTPAEGVAVLVLKRLDHAMADGDRILGVILGSALSHDGDCRSFGTPNPDSQEIAIREAFKDAQITFQNVAYVETHGTGTRVGDPCEIRALQCFGEAKRSKKLLLGSVKTNIGHTYGCSGVAGLIKCLLVLQHRAVPPHINFTRLNPKINLDLIPAEIPLTTVDLSDHKSKLVVGLNNFGLTGTNAHFVIQEATAAGRELQAQEKLADRGVHLIAISAKSAPALSALCLQYARALAESQTTLADFAFSVNTTRTHFQNGYRMSVVASSRQEAVELLQSLSQRTEWNKSQAKSNNGIAFIFTGQELMTQAKSSHSLYLSNHYFRRMFDRLESLYSEATGKALTDVFYGAEAEKLLKDLVHGPLAIFCLQVCLLEIWREGFGIGPNVVLGNGSGIYAALVAAGVLDVESAFSFVQARSAGSSVVLPSMKDPLCPLISGSSVITKGSELDEVFWKGHQVDESLSSASVDLVLARGAQVWVDIGLETDIGQSSSFVRCPSLSSSVSDAWPTLLRSLAKVYEAGVDVTWEKMDDALVRRTVDLPFYPFQGKKHWIPVPWSPWFSQTSTSLSTEPELHPLLGYKLDLLGLSSPLVFRNCLSASSQSWFQNYIEPAVVLVPEVAALEILLAVGQAVGEKGMRISEVEVIKGLELGRKAVPIQTLVREEAGSRSVTVQSLRDRVWVEHYKGKLTALSDMKRDWLELPALITPAPVQSVQETYADFHTQLGSGLTVNKLYSLRSVHELTPTEFVARSLVAAGGLCTARAIVLDAMLQTLTYVCLLDRKREGSREKEAPAPLVRLGQLRWYASDGLEGGTEVFIHASRPANSCLDGEWELRLYSASGALLADMERILTKSALSARKEFPQFFTEEWVSLGAPISERVDLSKLCGLTEEQRTDLRADLARAAKTRSCLNEKLDRVAFLYTLHDLRARGWAPVVGSVTSSVSLQGILAPTCRPDLRLLEHFLEVMEEEGLLEACDAGVDGSQQWRVLSEPPTLNELRRSLDTLEFLRPSERATFDFQFLRHCGESLLGIFEGQVDAKQLLLSSCAYLTASNWATESVESRSNSATLAKALSTALGKTTKNNGVLRVLEIGGGSGATAERVVAQLQASGIRFHYSFTESDPSLLAKAEQKFHRYSSMQFMALNIELDILEQGFTPSSYDIIIAPNAFQRTSDLLTSLGNAHELLSAGGFLFMIESFSPSRLSQMSFGLLEENSQFVDFRSASPYVTQGVWTDLLQKHGFESPILLPEDSSARSGVLVTRAQFQSSLHPSTEPNLLWVVMADAQSFDLESAVIKELHSSGKSVVRLQYSTGPLRAVASDTYELDFRQWSNFENFGQSKGSELEGMLYIRGGSRAALLDEINSGFVDDQECSCMGFLNFLRLNSESCNGNSKLALVTQGAEALKGSKSDPTAAALTGILSSFQNEHPELHALSIDLDGQESDLDFSAKQVVTALWQRSQERSLVFRDRQIWASRLTSLDVPLQLPACKIGHSECKSDASYLVTGGTGGIGLEVAKWLLSRGAGHVVLVGRTQPAAPHLVDKIRALGQNVSFVAADVSDAEQMKALFSQFNARFPPLKGIYHAAGVLADALVENQTLDTLRRVFKTKVNSTWLLHILSRHLDLDHFVLFSSVAAILGSQGQSNYAAGNRFMDALVSHRVIQLKLPGLSINWGAWAGAGAASSMSRSGMYKAFEAFLPSSGIRALERALQLGLHRVVIADMATDVLVEALPRLQPFLSKLAVGTKSPGEMTASDASAAPSETPAFSIQDLSENGPNEGRLRGFLESMLRFHVRLEPHEPLDPDRLFQHFGMDSLMEMELRSHLVKTLQVPLSMALFQRQRTLNELTKHLSELLATSKTNNAPRSGHEGSGAVKVH